MDIYFRTELSLAVPYLNKMAAVYMHILILCG
jgi:hypothetical protein